jgi:hypothetical protein
MTLSNSNKHLKHNGSWQNARLSLASNVTSLYVLVKCDAVGHIFSCDVSDMITKGNITLAGRLSSELWRCLVRLEIQNFRKSHCLYLRVDVFWPEDRDQCKNTFGATTSRSSNLAMQIWDKMRINKGYEHLKKILIILGHPKWWGPYMQHYKLR